MLAATLRVLEFCVLVLACTTGVYFSSDIVLASAGWLRTEASTGPFLAAWVCAVFFPMLAFVTCVSIGWVCREILRDARKLLPEERAHDTDDAADRQDPAQR